MSDTNACQQSLYESILRGDAREAVRLTQEALANQMDPQSLISHSMIPAMDEVGRRFESGQYFIPELIIAGRAMKGALELIRPLLAKRGVEPAGRVVLGTVKGDMHDIGKGLVGSMLEGAGFEVIDLGVDVPIAKFVNQAQTAQANIVAVSALLTTTMPAMREVVSAVRATDQLKQCKVILGGAPVTQQFADSVGADGYSPHAAGAVTLVRRLLAAG